MPKYEIVERRVIHHTFHVEADSLLEAARYVEQNNSAIKKTPWEKVDTFCSKPVIQHIMEVTP